MGDRCKNVSQHTAWLQPDFNNGKQISEYMAYSKIKMLFMAVTTLKRTNFL